MGSLRLLRVAQAPLVKLEAADAIELRLIEDADLGTPCRIGARQIVAQRRLGDRRQQQFAEPPLGK